jgi:ATP adenylyltransferase
MKDLYAPWRSPYSASLDKSKKQKTKPNECVFCFEKNTKEDEQNFILKRYKHCYAILNKYPYNAGHIMVIPFAHVKDLQSLEQAARHEIMDAVNSCIEIVQKVLKCEGINVGLNLGRASGAGIPNHLHMHILPRWEGDTNFLPTLANTKVISFDLKEIYEALKPVLNKAF